MGNLGPVTSLLWAQVSHLWELSRSFQPRGLDSSHLQYKETLRQASAVALLQEPLLPPMLSMYGLLIAHHMARSYVGERGHS